MNNCKHEMLKVDQEVVSTISGEKPMLVARCLDCRLPVSVLIQPAAFDEIMGMLTLIHSDTLRIP